MKAQTDTTTCGQIIKTSEGPVFVDALLIRREVGQGNADHRSAAGGPAYPCLLYVVN